jgi:hypothetical protein
MALKLEDCRRIFLDSTVISDLLNSPNKDKYDSNVRDRIYTVTCLIESLSANRSTKGERIFLISTISISEVFATSVGDYGKIYDSIQMLIGSNNVELISYSRKIAMVHNDVFKVKISDREIKNMQSATGYKNSPYVNIRERIRKDYLIVATAYSINPDVIFTADGEFANLCNHLGLHCVVTDKNNFLWNQGDDKIYAFQ